MIPIMNHVFNKITENIYYSSLFVWGVVIQGDFSCVNHFKITEINHLGS